MRTLLLILIFVAIGFSQITQGSGSISFGSGSMSAGSGVVVDTMPPDSATTFVLSGDGLGKDSANVNIGGIASDVAGGKILLRFNSTITDSTTYDSLFTFLVADTATYQPYAMSWDFSTDGTLYGYMMLYDTLNNWTTFSNSNHDQTTVDSTGTGGGGSEYEDRRSTSLVAIPSTSEPASEGDSFISAYGFKVTKIESYGFPIYSENYPVSADQSKVLFYDNGTETVADFDTTTFSNYVDLSGVYADGEAWRWHHESSDTVVGTNGNYVVKLCLSDSTVDTVYNAGATISRDASFQMIADNGYLAVVTGANSARVIDIADGTVILTKTISANYDWVAVDPTGNRLVALYGGGIGEGSGSTVWNLSGTYLGQAHPYPPHSTFVSDGDSSWLVCDNSSNAYAFTGNHYLVKALVYPGTPGFTQWDSDSTGGTDGVGPEYGVPEYHPMMQMNRDGSGWQNSLHISSPRFFNNKDSAFVIVTCFSDEEVHNASYEQEILKVWLDSEEFNENFWRLVHHRSTEDGEYWAQPHATAISGGKGVLYGSDWDGGTGESAVDLYYIELKEMHEIERTPLNTWINCASNVLNDVGDESDPGGTLSFGAWHSAVSAWNYGTWGELLTWGGGHTDYAGNEVYAFDIYSSTWSRLTDASTASGGSESAGTFGDGEPRPGHSYDLLEWSPTDSTMFYIAQAGIYSSGNSYDNMWEFHRPTLTWTKVADINGTPTQGGYCGYDEENEVIYTLGQLNWGETYENDHLSIDRSNSYSEALINADDSDLIYNDGMNGTFYLDTIWVVGDGDLVAITTGGSKSVKSGSHTVKSDQGPGWDIAPFDGLWLRTNHNYLIGYDSNNSADDVYRYNTSDNSWATITMTAGAGTSVTNVSEGIRGLFGYYESLNCYLLCTSITDTVKIMKTNPYPGRK